MRTIERSSAFKRDYKREAKGRHRTTLDEALKSVLLALATDQVLDARYRDHDLSGDWAAYRENHVKPDLLLIYRKSDADSLRSHGLVPTVSCSADAIGQGQILGFDQPAARHFLRRQQAGLDHVADLAGGFAQPGRGLIDG